jgi:imidazolonepropionase-like amidohydrolase
LKSCQLLTFQLAQPKTKGNKLFMSRTRYIVAGSLIDGSGTRVRKRVFLAVENALITKIGSAKDLPGNDGAEIVDLSHCTIVPPLVDCNVSLLRSSSVNEKVQSAYPEDDVEKKLTVLERHIHYCHTHGVQGVADNDEIGDLVARYQTGTGQGSTIDIRTPGNTNQSGQDYDYLKIAYSPDIEDAEAHHTPISHEELCRILQQKGSKKAVVVANGVQQVKEAIAAGCDAILQGYGMGEDNLRTMAKKKILWIPSLIRAKNGLDGASSGGSVCCRFSTRYVAPGKPIPGAKDFWTKVLDEQMKQLSFARKTDVTTAVGTGAGSAGILHGESMVEEMKLFIKSGYSLEEAICCASENGARFFNMENLGMLTVGHKATFLLTRGTAKQLPRKLAYLEGIYVDGAPSITYGK